MRIAQFFSFFFLLIATTVHSIQVDFKEETLSDTAKKIFIELKPAQNEWVYADMIKVDLPSLYLHMNAINSSRTPSDKFDAQFQQTKRVFDKETILDTTVSLEENVLEGSASLRVILYTNRVASPQEFIHQLNFTPTPAVPLTAEPLNPSTEAVNSSAKELNHSAVQPLNQQTVQQESKTSVSWSDYFSDIVKHTQSTPIRLLIVFILGALLSLTPCIYPMVPITAGILQAQGSSSLLYNFILALSYSCGMATTFAIFGLLASCTGPLCGQLLMQPFFIAGLIAVLAYLALSLLGLYELKIPTFFQTSSSSVKGGSLISIFVFGAASGTIASPCVSPGLALLLSVVAALGNKLLGFLMLFVFGVGLSMPLLIVGTFSSSLNLLPRAGLWMVEVKKIFGFIMLGMCLYYASYVIPLPYMLWITTLFLLGVAIYYLYHSLFLRNALRLLTAFIGLALIAAATFTAIQAFNATFKAHEVHTEDEIWLTEYAHALAEARAENKRIFIDFWATFCPVCLAINKKVLVRPATLAALQKQYVLLKVDGTYANNTVYTELRDRFGITGFPTFLVVDPTTEQVIIRMGGEIYEMAEAEFISKISY